MVTGYTVKTFHDKVDGLIYLIGVIKTKSGGYIFGGFSGETTWSSTVDYQQSDGATNKVLAGAWMYFLNTVDLGI